MRRVIVESPYAGGIIERWMNRRYARACIRDCLLRNEAPMASHLLYTQAGVLRDRVPDERRLGMEAGHVWLPAVDEVVVYVDRGISGGMRQGIERAKIAGIPVVYRTLATEKPRQ